MSPPGAEEPRDLTPARAQAALDLLAELRLRTAPHTSEARRLNTELRTEYRLKRPVDAVNAWSTALSSDPPESIVRKALLDWALAVGLHAAINLANLREVRRLIEKLVPSLPILEGRVGAIYAWSRRGHDVAAALAGLVGRSPVMDELRTQTWRAVFTDDVRKALALKAPHRLSVLITGEPGTGKEIVARTIAAGRGSLNPDGNEPGPLVTANIAALTPNLASSDLFGHVRGAFTGSTADRAGMFAAANGGVLFLDEIGDASHDVQVRLLRTLQEGTVRPVGADSEKHVEVRVLAATNRDLTQPREDGSTFRRDLLERLSVLRVACPPLRERLEDLPELVRHFVAMEIDLTAWPTIAEEVLEKLQTQTEGYGWIGNVRELRAATNRVIAGQPAMLPDQGSSNAGIDLTGRWGVRSLEEVKLLYTQSVLERVGGNKSEAARILGIDRNTLARYAKQMEKP